MLEKSNHPDSGILQIIQMIEQYYPDVPYTIELEDENNLKYMSKASEANKLPLNCNSKYAAGKVLYSSTLDSIIAQSYYNDTLFEVLDKLIFGDSDISETKIEENSRLNMIRITEEIGGIATYENFFYTCTQLSQDSKRSKKPVIPIAIYRAPNKNILGNDAPYMITNPEKGTLLLTGDIVFVLGDAEHNKEQRDKEIRKGVLNGDLSIGEGIKSRTIELTKEKLEKLDDDKILNIVQQELAGTEKERKKARIRKKKEEQEKEKLEVVDEEEKKELILRKDVKRGISDIAKIVGLDQKGTRIQTPREETKDIGKSVSSIEESFNEREFSDGNKETNGKQSQRCDNADLKLEKEDQSESSHNSSTVKQNYIINPNQSQKVAHKDPKMFMKESSPEREVEPSMSMQNDNFDSQAKPIEKQEGTFSAENDSDEDGFIIKPTRKVF